MGINFISDLLKEGKVLIEFAQLVSYTADRSGYVSYHIELREIHIINSRSIKIYMNHLSAIIFHKERWLFDDIVADVNDQVSTVNCTMQIIVIRKCSGTDVALMALVNYTFTHLSIKEEQSGLIDKFFQ